MNERLQELLDKADAGMDGVLDHLKRWVPKDDGSWALEREAFGMEDPAVIEARTRAWEATPEEPSPERTRPGQKSWREIFRENWPDKKVWQRRRWRSHR